MILYIIHIIRVYKKENPQERKSNIYPILNHCSKTVYFPFLQSVFSKQTLEILIAPAPQPKIKILSCKRVF